MRYICLLFLITLLFTPGMALAENQAVAILFDISRSVPPGDFQKAKDAVREFAAQAGPEDVVLIYVFGNETRKISISELDSIQATESYTVVYDAAFDAAQELSGLDADRKAIVIVSDGFDTRSVTVLEDTVAFANKNGIAIHSIAAGKANLKVLARMAKLTGGESFPVNTSDLAASLRGAIASQKSVPKEPVPVVSAPVQQSPPQPVPQPAVATPQPQPESRFPYLMVAAILGGAFILGISLFFIFRAFRDQARICPTCGKRLESYQTICPDCSSRKAVPSDGTQEVKAAGAEVEEEPIPIELLQKKPVSEEMLSKTFVLMETPLLVVRKGRNLGQTYSLNRAFPVSIGRSKVNEIHLDDITVSGQHCRIIPESGKHVLYDLESTNGTFLNDKKVNRAILKQGDIVKVGETQFLYKVEQHRA